MKIKTISRTFLIAHLFSILFFTGVSFAYAVDLSKPPAGDGQCGGTVPCSLVTDLPNLFKYIQVAGLYVVGALGFLAIFVAGAKVLASRNQPAEAAAAKAAIWDKLLWLGIGFLLIGGLLMAVISTFATSKYKTFFEPFLYSFNESPLFGIATAHAATATQHLPNALVVDTPYDVFVLLYQFAMRWVLIPIVIAAWVYSGFLFVAAQGSPEKIKEAKDRILKTAIWTIVLMLGLALAYAFRETFNQIFRS